jgi:hypothetical protein
MAHSSRPCALPACRIKGHTLAQLCCLQWRPPSQRLYALPTESKDTLEAGGGDGRVGGHNNRRLALNLQFRVRAPAGRAHLLVRAPALRWLDRHRQWNIFLSNPNQATAREPVNKKNRAVWKIFWFYFHLTGRGLSGWQKRPSWPSLRPIILSKHCCGF